MPEFKSECSGFDDSFDNILSQVLDLYMEKNMAPSFDFAIADLFRENLNETSQTMETFSPHNDEISA